MAEKYCPLCKQNKNTVLFHKNKLGQFGVNTYCIACAKIVRRKYESSENSKKNNLRWRFQLSVNDYEFLFRAQNGKCALCFTAPDKKALAVDHFHGHHPYPQGCRECVRGLLCGHCNMILGMLEKSPHLQNDLVRHYLAQRPLINLVVVPLA
jgi:hypothetical protein